MLASQGPTLAEVQAQRDMIVANLAKLRAAAERDDPADVSLAVFRQRQIDAALTALAVNNEEAARLVAGEEV